MEFDDPIVKKFTNSFNEQAFSQAKFYAEDENFNLAKSG